MRKITMFTIKDKSGKIVREEVLSKNEAMKLLLSSTKYKLKLV
jgi:hypothetical protein